MADNSNVKKKNSSASGSRKRTGASPASKTSSRSRNAGRSSGKKSGSRSSRKAEVSRGIPMKNEIQLVASFGIMILMMLSNFGWCGMVGVWLSSFFFGIFGCVQYVMPVAFFLMVTVLLANDYSLLAMKKCGAGFVVLTMISSYAQLMYQQDVKEFYDLFAVAASDHRAGGVLGGGIGLLLQGWFGTAGAIVIISCVLLLALIMLTQRSFVGFFGKSVRQVKTAADKAGEKRRQARKERETAADKLREKQCEEKIREMEEKKAQKATDKKAQKAMEEEGRTAGVEASGEPDSRRQNMGALKMSAGPAAEKKRKQPDIRIHIPIFTPEGEVKKKDSLRELHPEFYPFTPEDGKTEAFDGSLDFSSIVPDAEQTRETFSGGAAEGWPQTGGMADEMPQIPIGTTKADNLSDGPAAAAGAAVTGDEDTARMADREVRNVMPAGGDREHTPAAGDRPDSVQAGAESQSDFVQAAADGGADSIQTVAAGAQEPVSAAAGDRPDFMQAAAESQSDFVQETTADRPDSVQSADEAEMFRIVDDVGEQPSEGLPDEIVLSGREAQSGKKESAPQAGNTARTAQPEQEAAVTINRAGTPAPAPVRRPAKKEEYIFPPMNLLTTEKQKLPEDYDRTLKETAMKLQSTLESFGVRVTITDISCGPTVTRYEMFPEQGTKVSKILSLTDDIKLNLAASDIRIEAPIPGKAAIGIEVPNKQNMIVHFRELVDNRVFRNFKSKLAFAVGKDIGGKIVVADLAKMPHLLIAGATGSGKSVCINTLIMSILYKAKPAEVKLIMIDPKMVELSTYNGIPHLLIPVVTDPKKASGALNWAVAEMTDRYKKFTETGVRNIEGYNKKVDELIASGQVDGEKLSRMPQIVIIIDELADLMMVAPGEVEDAIVRLSQLARAAGIHLVIATQRPSVNVITGLIKANVPSRIAFAVSSGVDSRTIIDMNGAEKLLGRGDMLFYPSGYQKPVRVQGAFISDAEVGRVVEFLKENEDVAVYDADVSEKIENKIKNGSINSERDEYFEAAARFIMEKDKATIGMLQRMFKIGFNRAARIIDQLADAGIVGPEEGTKPRKILMSPEQLDAFFEESL